MSSWIRQKTADHSTRVRSRSSHVCALVRVRVTVTARDRVRVRVRANNPTPNPTPTPKATPTPNPSPDRSGSLAEATREKVRQPNCRWTSSESTSSAAVSSACNRRWRRLQP